MTAAAIVIAARQQAPQPADAEPAAVAVHAPEGLFEEVRPQQPVSRPLPVTEAAPVVEPKKAVASRAPSAAAAKTMAADATLAALLPAPSMNSHAADSAAADVPPAPEATTKVDVEEPAIITITGCLAVDQETIRLKDTTGAEAPKSRSWRSGFLKKRPAAVELVDASHSLDMSTYVGQRVAATGTLMQRTMRVRSLHRVTASCN